MESWPAQGWAEFPDVLFRLAERDVFHKQEMFDCFVKLCLGVLERFVVQGRESIRRAVGENLRDRAFEGRIVSQNHRKREGEDGDSGHVIHMVPGQKEFCGQRQSLEN